MNRKRHNRLMTEGDGLTAADCASLNQPTLHADVTSYVTAKYIVAPMSRLILTLTNLPITAANTTGASFGTDQIVDFPTGRIAIDGGTADLTFNWAGTTIVATGSGDFSFGTTGTADATLNSTDVDLMASTAMLDPFVAGVGTGKGVFVKDTEFDGTSTAKDLYLSIIIDDADVEDAGSAIVLISGTIRLDWKFLGDL